MNIEQSVLFRSGLDLDRLVSDAEASGFNPLTVLRAGGAAAYLVTEQHVGTPKAPAPKPVTAGAQNAASLFQSSPGVHGRSSRGSSALRNMRERKAKREERRERRERKTAVSRPSVAASGAGGFGAAGAGAAYGSAVAGRSLGQSSFEDWEEEIPTVVNPFSWDWWESNPYFSDVETGGEARYGDFGAIPVSVLTYAGDIAWNVSRGAKAFRDWDAEHGAAAGKAVREWLLGGPGEWFGRGGSAPPLSITVGGPNQTGL